ncbi:MAG: hypothetical protein ACT4PJ_06780 [Gemmatimonadaceae bacterium]
MTVGMWAGLGPIAALALAACDRGRFEISLEMSHFAGGGTQRSRGLVGRWIRLSSTRFDERGIRIASTIPRPDRCLVAVAR